MNKELKKQLDELDDVESITKFALKTIKKNTDKSSVKKIYLHAIEFAKNEDDFIYTTGNNLSLIAHSVANPDGLNDKSWAKELFEKAIESVDESDENSIHDEYEFIARHIADEKGLNDKKWAKEVYTIAIENTDDLTELASISNSIKQQLNDMSFIHDIYNNLIDKSNDAQSLTDIACNLVYYLDDKKWAKETFTKAIKSAKDLAGYYVVAEAIGSKDYYNDKKWAEEVRTQGYNEFNPPKLSNTTSKKKAKKKAKKKTSNK